MSQGSKAVFSACLLSVAAVAFLAGMSAAYYCMRCSRASTHGCRPTVINRSNVDDHANQVILPTQAWSLTSSYEPSGELSSIVGSGEQNDTTNAPRNVAKFYGRGGAGFDEDGLRDIHTGELSSQSEARAFVAIKKYLFNEAGTQVIVVYKVRNNSLRKPGGRIAFEFDRVLCKRPTTLSDIVYYRYQINEAFYDIPVGSTCVLYFKRGASKPHMIIEYYEKKHKFRFRYFIVYTGTMDEFAAKVKENCK